MKRTPLKRLPEAGAPARCVSLESHHTPGRMVFGQELTLGKEYVVLAVAGTRTRHGSQLRVENDLGDTWWYDARLFEAQGYE